MSAYIPTRLRQQIRKHFANCCAYCHTQEDLTVAIFEIEHIVTLSAGGDTSFKNLCLSCPTCNRYKGSRQTGTEMETGEEVLLFHPHNQIWREHFSWNEDNTQLIGLTPEGQMTISLLRMNRPQLQRVRRMWAKMGQHPPDIDKQQFRFV